MSNKILDALKKLDPADDKVWAENGEPILEAVQALVGDAKVTRKQLTDAAPTLNRATFEQWLAEVSPPIEVQKQVASAKPTEEALAEAEAEERELTQRIAQLQRDREIKQQEVRELQTQHALEHPPLKPAEAIQQHIASQAAERAARAGSHHQLHALLGPQADLITASPIDAALKSRPKQHANHSPNAALAAKEA